nr:hypothetical protein [Streptomyces sp. TRM72054]
MRKFAVGASVRVRHRLVASASRIPYRFACGAERPVPNGIGVFSRT